MVSIVFLLVLIGLCLASLFERALWERALCIVLLACYLIANGWHIKTLFSFGRGQFSEAIRYLQQNTRGKVVTVGGDHPFRIPVMVSFYAGLNGNTKEMKYFKTEEWPPQGPQWLIFHKDSLFEPTPPAAQLSDAAGHRFVFVNTYPTAPLSGLHWFIYHNSSPPE
jgi:hypothetical protein